MDKAQAMVGVSIIGMILAIVEVLIFIAFYPTMAAFIVTFKANSTSTSLNLFME